MNLPFTSEPATNVRAALSSFVMAPTTDTLCVLSRAMSGMTAYADSENFAGRDQEVSGFWIDSSSACEHAHEHIQSMNRTFATGAAPTALEVRTVKYAVLAATALFDDAVRSSAPSPADVNKPYTSGPEHDASVFGIATAAVHLLGTGWRAEPGLHNTMGDIQRSDGESYLLTVGDIGDMAPELYVENGDTRHVLWGSNGEELPDLARLVADTISNLAQH